VAQPGNIQRYVQLGKTAKRVYDHVTSGHYSANKRRIVGTNSNSKMRKTLPTSSGRRAKPVVNARSGSVVHTKKYKRNKQQKLSKRGILFHQEIGGTSISNDVTYMGHVTCPVKTVNLAVWLAIVKEFYIMCGADIGDLNDNMDTLLGDTMTLQYSSTIGAGTNQTVYTFGGATSVYTLAVWLTDDVRPWNSDTDVEYQFQNLIYAQPKAGTGTNFLHPVYMSLRDMDIHIIAKSHMKIQNRTVTVAADIEADDVDNVPIAGRIYEGKGTGMITIVKKSNAPAAQPLFFANITTGVIAITPASGPPLEMPEPDYFDKIDKVGNIKIEPGEIKHSYLNWTKSMKFNSYRKAVQPFQPDASNATNKRLGTFRLFAIEKMIQYTTNANISSVYMIDYDLAVKVTHKRQYFTSKFFSSVRDNNI
jgi:hypothetical protein